MILKQVPFNIIKLFCFAWRQASRSVRWLLVPYLIYLVFYGCASTTYPSNVIAQYTCPPLQEVAYPVWFAYVQPHVTWLDDRFDLVNTVSNQLHPVKQTLVDFDEKHQISYTLDTTLGPVIRTVVSVTQEVSRFVSPYLSVLSSKTRLYYGKNVHPLVLYYGARYKYTLESTGDAVLDYVKQYTWLVLRHVNHVVSHINASYISPVFAKIVAKASKYAFVRRIGLAARSGYLLLLEKSVLITSSLQRKTDFVRSEWANLVKFNEIRSTFIRNRDEMNTVVSHILEEIAESAAPTLNTEPSVDTGLDPESSDFSDDDYEPITYTYTQTVFTTSSSSDESEVISSIATVGSVETKVDMYQPEAPDEELVTYDSSSSQAQIDYELSYWQAKVQKTLDLAVNNLEQDFGPFLTEKTEDLRQEISSNFSTLQLNNYQLYKEMNELIVSINKDAEFIKETNTTIEEPEVDRQIMRDKIAAAYANTESEMKVVEQKLNEAHVMVMTQYYKMAQDTVDVLESFADTAILDFSSRLSGLLEILQNNEDFDDAMSWSAWKSFHKVKESIFEIRDQIFNDANAYKYDARGAKVPRGLEQWAEYLGKVNFHINFLLRDNAEYLQLVRAKANVAYQQREGLTYKLKQEEKARQEQLERELREAEEEKERQAQVERELQAKAAEEEKKRQEQLARELQAQAREEEERKNAQLEKLLMEQALIEEAKRLKYEQEAIAKLLEEEERAKIVEQEKKLLLEKDVALQDFAEVEGQILSKHSELEPETESKQVVEEEEIDKNSDSTSFAIETTNIASRTIELVLVLVVSEEPGSISKAVTPETEQVEHTSVSIPAEIHEAPIPEAGQEKEYVVEGDELLEMKGEREPEDPEAEHDEL